MAKRIVSGKVVFVCLFILLFTSCVIFDSMVNKSSMKKSALEDGEAELVVMRPKDASGGRIGLYLDGQIVGHLSGGNSKKFIVKQGDHTLFAEWVGKDQTIQGNTLLFSTNLDRTIFRTALQGDRLTLLLEGKTALKASGGGGEIRSQLDSALDQVFSRIEQSLGRVELPQNKERLTIAVMDIDSSDTVQKDYIASTLIQRFVTLGKYDVVERNRLDTIKKEVSTQLSGDVSDDEIADIGRQFGAAVVITGKITPQGPNSILEIRAIDVETAKILGIESQRF
jgi:TolB-like protein